MKQLDDSKVTTTWTTCRGIRTIEADHKLPVVRYRFDRLSDTDWISLQTVHAQTRAQALIVRVANVAAFDVYAIMPKRGRAPRVTLNDGRVSDPVRAPWSSIDELTALKLLLETLFAKGEKGRYTLEAPGAGDCCTTWCTNFEEDEKKDVKARCKGNPAEIQVMMYSFEADSVTSRPALVVRSRSFTNYALKDDLAPGKKKPEELVRYEFDTVNRVLRKRIDADSPLPSYVRRKARNRSKRTSPYLSFKDIDSFKKCRQVLAAEVMKDLVREFPFANVKSVSIDACGVDPGVVGRGEANRKELYNIARNRSIRIVPGEYALKAALLKRALAEQGVESEIGDADKDSWNFILTDKPPADYSKRTAGDHTVALGWIANRVTDESLTEVKLNELLRFYDKKRDDKKVEEQTGEKKKGSRRTPKAEAVLDNIVHDLLVKEELLNGQLHNPERDLKEIETPLTAMTIMNDKDDKDVVVSIVVSDTGALKTSITRIDDIKDHERRELMRSVVGILTSTKRKYANRPKNIMLQYPDGHIDLVRETSIQTFDSDLDAVEAFIKEKGNKGKTSRTTDENRDRLKSLADIHWFSDPTDCTRSFYTSGKRPVGLNTNDEFQGVLLKAVQSLDETPPRIEQVVGLVGARAGRLMKETVYPFLMKHLDELANAHNIQFT